MKNKWIVYFCDENRYTPFLILYIAGLYCSKEAKESRMFCVHKYKVVNTWDLTSVWPKEMMHWWFYFFPITSDLSSSEWSVIE